MIPNLTVLEVLLAHNLRTVLINFEVCPSLKL